METTCIDRPPPVGTDHGRRLRKRSGPTTSHRSPISRAAVPQLPIRRLKSSASAFVGEDVPTAISGIGAGGGGVGMRCPPGLRLDGPGSFTPGRTRWWIAAGETGSWPVCMDAVLVIGDRSCRHPWMRLVTCRQNCPERTGEEPATCHHSFHVRPWITGGWRKRSGRTITTSALTRATARLWTDFRGTLMHTPHSG